jgi:hypothetical protein
MPPRPGRPGERRFLRNWLAGRFDEIGQKLPLTAHAAIKAQDFWGCGQWAKSTK